jgi:hypothetical protein
MDWSNLLIVTAYIVLARCSNNHITSQILALNILVQITFDIFFVHFGMYRIADPSWFFVVKGLILMVAIGMLFIRHGNLGIAILLFINMLYLYGMWQETVFTTISQPLHSYFAGVMFIIIALELLYMFRVSNFYGRVRDTYRRVVNHCFDSVSRRHVDKYG